MSEAIRGGRPGEKVGALLSRLREKREAALPTRIQRIARDGAYPLSSGQQRLWFIEQLEPGNPAYNIPVVVRFRGLLDIGVLRRSLREIARRHGALRTTFQPGGEGAPVQVIAPPEAVTDDWLPVLSLAGLAAPADPEKEILRLARSEAERPFDLAHGPLFRATLLRLGAEEHVLLLTMHHIVSDAWSMAVLLNEARALYQAYLSGLPSPLPELQLQYIDYAAWLNRWLDHPAAGQQLEYWKRALAAIPETLRLPSDRPRPPVRTPRGGRYFFTLPVALRDGVLARARAEEVTPFVLLLATYATLLYRLSGQDDIPLGTPVANRQRVELQDLIGFFVNTLVLRADLSGGVSFRELLQRLSRAAVEAFDHQDLPFDRLVSELQPERRLSETPLFQAAFAFQNVPMPTWELSGVVLSPVWIDSGTSIFDLMFNLEGGQERLAGWLEYSADLFDEATVGRFAQYFAALLASQVEEPARRIAEAPLLHVAEREQIAAWSAGPPLPGSDFLPQRLAAQAARTPAAVALACGGREMTYAELDLRAGRLAGTLRRCGAGPGACVGICLERSFDLVTAMVGTVKAGACYVPLDPTYPSERWSHMLRDAGIRVLLTQEHLLPHLPAGPWEVLCLDRDRALIDAGPGAAPPVAAGDLAYIIYTSGSTGRPKGVAVYQRGFLNLLDWYLRDFAVRGDDRFLLVGSLSFDMIQKSVFAPILAGARLVIPPPGPYDPAVYVAEVERAGVTRINCTPSAFYPLIERPEDGPRLASLRGVSLGGEPISLPRLARWRTSPWCNAEILNTYGPTECTDLVAWHRLEPPGRRDLVPIGRPLPGVSLWVVSAAFEPVPVGVVGYLCAGGTGVSAGYLNDAPLTAGKFLPDPFAAAPGSRLYWTGDLARWLPTGELEYLGRSDFQVKVRGFRIEPGEIESVLESHPGVHSAVVLARELGDGAPRLVAYLRPDPQWVHPAELAAEARAWLRERLPDYMVPNAWVLVEEFPLTPSGKVNRQALPAPEGAGEDRAGSVAPRTATEEVLAVIWAEVLKLPRAGVTQSFFDLGGHSILGTQMISRVRAAFGIELPVRALFEAPTVERLAARIDTRRGRREAGTAPPLVPLQPTGELPLSFAQQRLWFLHLLEPASAAYHIPAAVRLSGGLDPAALAATLGWIVRRHAALRTTFAARDEGAAQIVAPPPLVWPLPLIDLAALAEDVREAEAIRVLRDEAVRPFDLGRGPLLRTALLRLGGRDRSDQGDHALCLVMHHIVSDGWSMGVLVREIAAAYPALAARRAPELPELPVQYSDFALWQRTWLQGEELARQVAFWRQQLAGAPVLELSTDRPRTGTGRAGGRVPVRLSADLTSRLAALARRESATLFMALFGAFALLLERWTGQDDVVVGISVANRTRPEIEPLIGFFVNTLALRTRLASGESPRELLRSVRSAALEAFAHQDVPFERLVEELSPERRLDQTPLFQVMLTFQNAPGGATELPGLLLTPLEIDNAEAKVDWALTLWESEGGIDGVFTFRSAFWDAATARRAVGHLEVLATGLAGAPDGWISELPLLTAEEEQQLRAEQDESRRPGSESAATSIHGRFAAQAARAPDAPAVVCEDRSLRYAELDAHATALARRLRALGVGPEVPVALCLERSLAAIVALLGVLKAGGAYLPLDLRFPPTRMRQMLADARVSVVLTIGRLRSLLPEDGARILLLDELLDETGRVEDQGIEGLSVPDQAALPEQLAYVLFTSGSTGTPRGVGVEHRQLLNYVHGLLERLDLDRIESFATVSTLAADLGNTSIFPALLTGRCLHVISEERLSHPEAMAEYFDRHSIDVLKIVPSHLLALETPGRPAGPLPRHCLILGGEASFRDHAGRIRAAAPQCTVINHYGPTETTVGVLTHRWQEVEAGAGGALPLGRPLANSWVYVVDAAGRRLPAGVPGELWIGGAGVSRGYLHRPDRTAERFLPDPWSGGAGARVYRSGDLVRRRPDGVIEFLGRVDHQVKIRGFRVELGEIEAALERHPEVRERVVMARESRPGGERRLVAYVATGRAGEARADAAALQRWLGERLPDFMVPADFVFLDHLPLTPNGKVDRAALPAPAAAAPAAPRAADSFAGELLTELWAEVLGRERVDPADDFFDLGGHSLLATQLMSRVRRAFGVEVPLRALFEAPTPAQLGRRIAEIACAEDHRPAPPLRRTPRDAGAALPLSFAQQRLWFLYQLDPSSPSYNVPRAVRLAGALQPPALAAALTEVVRRHEVLRTSFPVAAGLPAQVIAPPRPLHLPCVDLGGLPAALRESEVARCAAEEACRPFDLGRGPHVRVCLLSVQANDHVLLLTLHHIVSDGWSTGILVREMGALYAAFAASRPSPLPELPIQYADFAQWQRQWLSGAVLEEQFAYWRRQLAGVPDGLDLPLDRPRPVLPTLAGDLRARLFPADLQWALHRTGRERGATFFMVLLAAFAALLSRLTRQSDVVTGSPIANRNRVEIEGLIGFFVNTLVLRVDAEGPPAFAQLLERVREVALGASAHQDLPFERLVEELAPERNLGRTPLFQVMFVVQNAPAETLRLPGLEWTALPGETRTANFDLTLRLVEAAEGLQASLEYRRELFDASTIDRLLGHLEILSRAAVADPAAPISRLPLLSAAERGQLALAPLARLRRFPADIPLHRLFECQAARSPAAVAAVCEGARLTYAELDEAAGRLAARLRRLGVGPEVRVALWLDRSLELVVGLLGVLKAGGAYVPVDPSYPEKRLRYLLADAGAQVLVSVRGLRDRLPAEVVEDIATVLLDALDEEGEGESGEDVPFSTVPDLPEMAETTAYVIYTSGSTGEPKGVPVSHANVARLLTATREWFGFDERDVWTLFHSYAFDFSVWEFWGALLAGGRLVVVPYWVSRSPEAFYDLLVRERVTVLSQTPSAFYQLAAIEEGRPGGAGDLALRWVVFGGEALEPRRLGPWFARHGDRRPVLVNMYGITETTVHVTFRPLGADDLECGSVIGVPIPDLYVHILDAEREPAPLGVPGEIHVGGAGLARGYLGRPALTAQRFVPDPFAPWPGARLYASGDLARRRLDGELEYLGRADQQVKIRGFRIEPGEIEAVLARHPAVREAVVLARDGQKGRRLVAWLGVGSGPAPGSDELRSFLNQRLPDHMIPAVFIPLVALPLTAHGKIDRRALPEPEAVRPDLGADYVAPRSPAESALAQVWAEVLEVDRVGIDDNFFALGGDSIRSIRVLSLAADRGLRFSLPQLFQHQTIADLVPHQLAAAVEAEETPAPSRPFSLLCAADRAALPEDVEDAYPLSALQLGMLFHSELGADSAAYHNVFSVFLARAIDGAALRAAAAELARRHPILRTSFDLGGFSQPLQLVHRHRAVEVPVTEEDLRGLPPADREEAVSRRFAAEKARRFEWSRAPLLRFHVQHLGDAEAQLLWAEHHAILDGWSMAVMLAELFRLYRSGLAELPPAPATPYRDFIALEREVLDSEAARGFWSDTLRDLEPARLLPWHTAEADQDRTPLDTVLPEPVIEGLRSLTAAAGVPLKSVFLAAHLQLLGRLTGSRDVVTGLVTNGRPEAADADRMLGLFLNTVPLRASLAGGTWVELARQTFDAERTLLPFRRYPLPEIQREAGVSQLFEVTFNYINFYVLEEAQQASGLDLDNVRAFSETSFGLAVDFNEDAASGAVVLRMQRDPAVVNQTQLRSSAALYQRVLAAMAAAPASRYDTADLLTPAERQQILAEWNDTGLTSILESELVHEVFEHWAALTPDAPALLSSCGLLTYRELNRWANRVARLLRAGGAGPDIAIGLYVERSAEMIAGLLGILKAGAAYVPLDPAFPRERLLLLIEDVHMPVVLTQERLAGDLAGLAGGVVCVDYAGEAGAEDDADLDTGVLADNLAYIIFTSGSTGRPKPVGVSHRALTHHMAGTRQVLRMAQHTGDRVLQFSTLNFDGSVDQIFIALVNGACLGLREEGLWSAQDLEEKIAEMGLTIIDLPTGYWSEWVRARSVAPARSERERLRVVYVGGEAMMSEELAVWWRNPRNHSIRLLNAYGPTETVIAASFLEATSAASAGALFERVAIGRPLGGRSLHVVDPDGRLAPVGAPGELLIGGEPILARGYLGRPDLTAEKFQPDPFSALPGARLYRTGDLGRYLPDGRREFLGRRDDQVKVRGFRIELGEVEAALAEHPGVHRAAAVVHGKGPGDRRLVAYVTPSGTPPTASDLRAWLRGKLPEPMIPSDIVFLDRLPLTQNGKVDRRALPAPDFSVQRSVEPGQAPRNDLEAQLAALWEELLGVSPIGITDDFLELGGHSLLAVRLMARIERSFGLKLPISVLLEESTVERLAAVLERRDTPSRRSPLVVLRAGAGGRPLFLVHPVGGDVFAYVELARKLPPERPVYGLQAVLDGDPTRVPAIEELAAHYLQAIREVQAEGPYELAGWSLGAVIAYEMATQVESAGGGVSRLTLIDPPPPQDDPNELDDTSALVGLAEDLVRLSGQPVLFGREALEELDLEAGLARLVELGRAERVLPPDVGKEQLRDRLHLYGRHVRALQRYAPGRYGGPVVLLRAADSLPAGDADPTSGWGSLADVDVHVLAGDHYSLLRNPAVDALAERLGSANRA